MQTVSTPTTLLSSVLYTPGWQVVAAHRLVLTTDWERQNPIQCRHSRQPFTHHSQYMLAMLSSVSL